VSRADLDALTKRLEALDEVQLRREMEWQEIRERLERGLARQAAYWQRREQREEGDSGGASLRDLLRTKYPKLGG